MSPQVRAIDIPPTGHNNRESWASKQSGDVVTGRGIVVSSGQMARGDADLLKLQGISKSFAGVPVLRNVGLYRRRRRDCNAGRREWCRQINA